MKWIMWKRTSMLHSCYWSILCLQTLICRFLSDCGVSIPNWFSSLFPNPSKRPAVVNKKVKSVPQHTASTLHWAGMLTCHKKKKKNKENSFFYSLLVLCSVTSKRVIVLLPFAVLHSHLHFPVPGDLKASVKVQRKVNKKTETKRPNVFGRE